MNAPALQIDHLARDFIVGGRVLRAVDDVSFALEDGETLGVVGESGCGKSTLARMVLKLVAPTSGRIRLMGEDVTDLSEREMRPRRKSLQAVFQDPVSSLNPRLTVQDIIAEPLRRFAMRPAEMRARVAEMLNLVGLPADAAGRYPHAFSGGQRQRIAIARALAGSPRVVIFDEATSALDVSVQAQILNLVADLQERLSLSVIFISHNLGAVRHVSRRVAVMYLGRIVEIATEEQIFDRPAHPYTQALIAAAPEPTLDEPDAPPLIGETPSPLDRPSGCHFHPRCPRAQAKCREEDPVLVAIDGAHLARCFFPG
ncbi:oligopeptide/dipeptide ABC transporter ATP-binding protein [Terrarubrum flagellatum]|uniref:ABC transporter ATP-binding protein n=1 Tax=Terrirubrum flagellatum TaxID=2895980 RepID=UPI003144F5D0